LEGVSRTDRQRDVAALGLLCDFVEELAPAFPVQDRELYLEALLRLRRLKVELASRAGPEHGAKTLWQEQ